MNPLGALLLYGALALTTTLVLTPVVRSAAMRWGRISQAQPDRWHERPTPNVGGVAIFAGFALAVIVGTVLDSGNLASLDLSERAVVPLTHREGLLLASVLIFVIGLVDDFVPLRPSTKLVGELAAAAVLLMSGIGVWFTGVYVVDVMVSLFWFIGITNALNLLDNMDGLAAGVGAIAAAFLGINFLIAGDMGLAGVSSSSSRLWCWQSRYSIRPSSRSLVFWRGAPCQKGGGITRHTVWWPWASRRSERCGCCGVSRLVEA